MLYYRMVKNNSEMDNYISKMDNALQEKEKPKVIHVR